MSLARYAAKLCRCLLLAGDQGRGSQLLSGLGSDSLGRVWAGWAKVCKLPAGCFPKMLIPFSQSVRRKTPPSSKLCDGMQPQVIRAPRPCFTSPFQQKHLGSLRENVWLLELKIHLLVNLHLHLVQFRRKRDKIRVFFLNGCIPGCFLSSPQPHGLGAFK